MTDFIRARYICPMDGSPLSDNRIEDGFIVFDENKILLCDSFDSATPALLNQKWPNLRVIKPNTVDSTRLECKDFPDHEKYFCHNGALLPGFIKAHGHDHEAPIIGVGRDVPLTVWLDESVNIFTSFLTEKWSELELELGVNPNWLCYAKARMDDIYYGITSCMIHQCNYAKYHCDELVKVNEQAGTNMIVAVGSQDRNYFKEVLDYSPSTAIDRLEGYVKKHGHLTRTKFIPGPDQDFSNSPEMLRGLKQWAKDNNTLIHIHSSEEVNTTNWFKEKYGQSPVEYFDSIGFLDEDTILAHQVQSTPNDLDILQRTGTKIIHNPTANAILGSGMPDIVEMRSRGIPVAVSTDGSGTSDNQNILAAAKLASQYQKAHHKDATVIPARAALEMITRDAADILKMNTGQLVAGKMADIVLIDLTKPNLIPTQKSNLVENIIWSGDGSEVDTVIAGGKIIMQQKKHLTLDGKKITEKVSIMGQMFDQYKRTAQTTKSTGANL